MNYYTIKRIKRYVVVTLLLIALFSTIFILIKAYSIKEWNTLTASLAVIVAISTLYISMKNTWQKEDEQEPDFLINWDFKSNNVSNYLTIQNIGGGNAYDISIEWIKTLKNSDNEPVSFGIIPTLAKGQIKKTMVSTIPDTWSNAKEYGTDNENFTGKIFYKLRKNSKRYQQMEFSISLGHKRYRNNFEDIEQEFYAQGKKIVKQLELINKHLDDMLEIKKGSKE